MSVFLLACAIPSPELTWFTDCGDPACGGYSGPVEGIPVCADEEEGATCTEEGAACDLENDCNGHLVCAAEDPKATEGGCPVSRLKYKKDVRYLSVDDRARLAGDAQALRLAEWTYRWEDDRRHVGIVLDDLAGGPAVNGDQVDLYGYTSLVLAAVQEQQRRMEAQDQLLRAQAAEIASLQARLAALEAAPPPRGR